MITANVIQRVFCIKADEYIGNFFAVERTNKQCLVTALHLLKPDIGMIKLQIFHERQWKTLDVEQVGATNDEKDIAALAPEFQLATTDPLVLDLTGIVAGQRLYFLGFHHGIMGDSGTLNRRFPFPLVKSGILCAFNFETNRMLWLDGHNNLGFSSRPVVFIPGSESASDHKRIKKD